MGHPETVVDVLPAPHSAIHLGDLDLDDAAVGRIVNSDGCGGRNAPNTPVLVLPYRFELIRKVAA